MTLEERVVALSAELAERTRELERSNRLKSQFLANMSHELRTPLNAVIGFSDLLLENRAAMPAAHVEYAESIYQAGRQLLSVINAVLHLAEIEAGEQALAMEDVDPNLELEQALLLVAPAASRAGVTLTSSGRSSRLLRADRQHLRQILVNLTSNAIKFSPPGSSAVVEIRDDGPCARISIRDHGVGITGPVLRELFKPFFQADSSMTRSREGVGLGLAITKRLVEQLGGTIEVESIVGQGSTFSFTLPAAGALPAARAVAAAPRPGSPQPGEARPAPPEQASGDLPLVLVVEDDRVNARLIEAFLEHNGYSVARAWTAMEALNIARRRKPRAILLDLILSEGEDGFVVLGQLKEDAATRAIPVVVISSLPEGGRSRQLGASGFLLKPVEPAPLLELLGELAKAGG